ncbi:IQ domain-containing protein IQM2-like [Gossypium arboreum]|uniref:IQ domain-containing protein IQM2-like n=1 Tax=Gossypium arboreum TaxID=29729 RepID=UPI0022F1C010|nr:IQ domain-containing protein IQM2-like [Gossypium arboreum]
MFTEKITAHSCLMGVAVSSPLAKRSDVKNGIQSVTVKSIHFDEDEAKTLVRSISYNSLDPEPLILISVGSKNMVSEGSVSFKGLDLEQSVSAKSPPLDKPENVPIKAVIETPKQSPVFDPSNPQHEAAIRLQKVYKSFRTRRKLADCAVLVEQTWWKLLDFAELKRSSISFFDIGKHETAISRWSRARTRAAKVGKGLSKNEKAQKLALQHWLEAIDPRHRYGHNLHSYYNQWLHSQSKEPFFYWLDIGEGKEVNIEKCPRSKLQLQCIKYLSPIERKPYEVMVVNGKFVYKQTGKPVHTNEETGDAKWIFVLSTSKILYVGVKKKGTFQHSSFLAGGATIAAGRLVVDNGILKAVWPHSGHYRPLEENFNDFISFLRENNVDLNNVKMTPVDEEGNLANKQRNSNHFRCNSSEDDFNFEANEINAKDSIDQIR